MEQTFDNGGKPGMTKIVALLNLLIDSKFYGELLIKFESGKIVLCRKTENIKL